MKAKGHKIAWATGIVVLLCFTLFSEKDAPAPSMPAAKSPRAAAVRQARAQQAARLEALRGEILALGSAATWSDLESFLAKQDLDGLLRLRLDRFEGFLADCGLSPQGDSAGLYYHLWEEYISANGHSNSRGLITWLEQSGDKRLIQAVVLLDNTEAERSIALVLRAFNDKNPDSGDSRMRENLLSIIFEKLAVNDPVHGLELAKSMEDPGLAKEAVRTITTQLDPETFPPEQWDPLFALFTDEEREAFSYELGGLGKHLSHLPLDQVLARFPMGESDWQRNIARCYIISRSKRNPDDVWAYLQSDASAGLNQELRDLLVPRCRPLISSR